MTESFLYFLSSFSLHWIERTYHRRRHSLFYCVYFYSILTTCLSKLLMKSITLYMIYCNKQAFILSWMAILHPNHNLNSKTLKATQLLNNICITWTQMPEKRDLWSVNTEYSPLTLNVQISPNGCLLSNNIHYFNNWTAVRQTGPSRCRGLFRCHKELARTRGFGTLNTPIGGNFACS